ncbi:peptide chain release factor 2 [Fructilactobacillus myrtifloralis]|uniref:Peptide chain release factor 2 n=1 Tax=Fructilactobacillus myrtifloralis TaxID=2940301 RepID=A0ABY5BRD4_9LACO|nr:peptide chain release factor 2 [Fructilactobacillus myrtifloralis]USS84954.1 peptide chain release factor 2 [Fructilactobacillus myrtifloralis]
MELSTAKAKVAKINDAISNFGRSLDLDQLNEDISINEAKMAQPGFWDDQSAAKAVIETTNHLKQKYDRFHDLQEAAENLAVSLELLTEADDPELHQAFEQDLAQTEQDLESYQLNLLLNGKYDHNNAIVEIHPGAGGTEAEDWAEMLLRMYNRWAEQNHFQVEVDDYQPGEVAGLSSVTLTVRGENAYGYLQAEKGIHRLVRLSPFDSAGRRHTSFASVDVMPELDDSVEVNINPDDLRVDVFRSSGAGGQHINKTSSAVRITHLPTGIVTASQAQRSQLQNRVTALNMLKSKLYEREEQKKAEEKAKLAGTQLEIGWGSQIRSYVFHPYTMVKDHRTGHETANGKAVMDGDLNPFISDYLQWKLQQNNE